MRHKQVEADYQLVGQHPLQVEDTSKPRSVDMRTPGKQLLEVSVKVLSIRNAVV